MSHSPIDSRVQHTPPTCPRSQTEVHDIIFTFTYSTFRRRTASWESVSQSVGQLVGQPVNARELAGFLQKVPYTYSGTLL